MAENKFGSFCGYQKADSSYVILLILQCTLQRVTGLRKLSARREPRAA